MELRNKKTGEIIELLAKPSFVKRENDFLQGKVNTFNSLAELNEEWEDYEESKKYWLISPVDADVEQTEMEGDEVDTFNKQIGNYFETREEARKRLRN